ncbi:DUF1236 domain-containing protein [Bradyrhizobium sp.]|uniref:DUF1236 domain-containing protein n=1 Tax=Bradyrhizobium sp. TaxID=376 RepID=UPI004038067E
MTNRFLISVAAAALIAGTGFANAQGAGGGMKSEGGAGSSYQQAPSSGGGAATQQRDDSGMKSKSGQSDKGGTVGQAPDKGSKDMKAQRREDMKGGMKGEGREKGGTVGQAPDKGGAATKGREDKGGATMGREDRMKDPGQKGATDTNRMQQKEGTTDSNRPQGAQTGSQTTTGMAPAAPPPEKRSQITTAIKSEKFQDVGANVNVNVVVGTRLPATIRFHPLPPRIVEIYPEWRGYQVVLIKGRYVIVRPKTHEIVYIIEG